jgi:AcrR family transcriptional regulator
LFVDLVRRVRYPVAMTKTDDTAGDGEAISATRILEAARTQVRRFGENKTNVVDIARSLGTSHSTIYRHFRSKAEVFDAIVADIMRDEETLAETYVKGTEPASTRLRGLLLALHRHKVERYARDPEVYQLYRRVVDERPDIVHNYAVAMTRLIAAILASGVAAGEFTIDDIDGAAGVVRDAAIVFVHPAHVAAAAKAGVSREADLHRMMTALMTAYRHGVALNDS